MQNLEIECITSFRWYKFQLFFFSQFEPLYVHNLLDLFDFYKMNCIKVDIKNNRTIFTKEEIPKAETDADVIIKVAYSGFCGTDLHIIKVIWFLILNFL